MVISRQKRARVVAEVTAMVDPPEVEQILRLKREQGWGARRIGRELGISRTTVTRYLGLGRFEPYQRKPAGDVLEAHRQWAEARFLEVRGNVRVLHREFAQRGLAVGYSTLARAVKPLRDKLAALERATTRFETAPGEQMQVDFGEQFVPIAGVRTKVHLCVLTLGYSRRTFVRAYLSERQEQWLATLEAGFHHFGGVPRELLVDNAKALVREHDVETGQVTFAEAFLSFCRLHGTQPRACRPFRARTKGKVESGVKYVKRNALAGMSFESFEALEAHLAKWTREVADLRVHGTTFERPIDRFEAERPALLPMRVASVLPLPQQRKVPSDALVQVDTNRYPVPLEYVGRTVQVQVEAGMVAIRCDGRELVRYAELKGQHRCARLPGPSASQRVLPQHPPPLDDGDLLAPYAALGNGGAP